MSFLEIITKIESVAVNSYYDQLYAKRKTEAEAQFDANLKAEVILQLEKTGLTFPNEGDFETYAAESLTKVTITDTNTSMICKDAVVDAGNVTDFGTVLVEWKGDGYDISINAPVTNITTFNT